MPEFEINPERLEKSLPARVYYVATPDDDTVLLALDVRISGNTIRWFDTVRERTMLIGQIEEEALNGVVVFRRSDEESGGTYTFTPLDLKTYMEKVKDNLVIPQVFADEEQMLTALEKTRENAW